MSFAVLTVASDVQAPRVQAALHWLVAPLQAVVGFFAPWQSESRLSAATPRPPETQVAQPPARTPAHSAGPVDSPRATNIGGLRATPARSLKVVRVAEPSTPRKYAGRMVISGRMADVCAELDRLAALEDREITRR